jgi:lantibiotic leader peptide-processing serine protease
MRKALFAVVALAAAAMIGSMAVGTHAGSDGRPTRYVIVYSPSSAAAMKAAVVKAGGRVIRANNRVGVATVVSADARFKARIRASSAIQGVARDRVIGRAIPGQAKRKLQPKFSEEYLRSIRKASKGQKLAVRRKSGGNRAEPLAALQWDMKMIRATTNGSYRKQKGSKRVLVGIIDTGIDGSHPDIAPNFNRALSRNFTVDIPFDPLDPTEPIDGPCEDEPDNSCNDPNDVDENSHGTHVASTVGSPINGLGMAGVAPNVTLVNLRAGQDSGFFFLQPSVDAFTFAADHGIDVVNMSYFIDPWLYNCRALAADSPEQQAEQRTIIDATQRALDYAHQHGVTLVSAAGNARTDLGMPTPVTDTQSPNFPLDTAHPRVVNNGCLDLPTEGNNVISVSSVGPSKIKADYSNYGYEEIDVAAPGGWFRDDPWHPGLIAPPPLGINAPASLAAGVPNQILAAYPKNVAEEAGDLNPDGTPNNPFVVRDCGGSTCAYYQWIQGTSMASPHATGVAALIVSEYGERRGGGISLHPLFTQAYLEASAADTPCMTPNPFTYTHKGRDASYTTFCEGTPEFNGVYGHGIVDALGAVTFGNPSDNN